jgi:hypothetical protein
MAIRTRPYDIHIMVTEEEKQLIEAKRKLAGFSNTGAYMRKIAIDGQIFKIDPEPLRNVSAQMTGIGRNINQIAKRVNTFSNIYKDDVNELKEEMEEIWQLLKSILSKLP